MTHTDLNNLVASGVNVTISVTTEQLRQAFLAWGECLLEAVKPQEEDALLTIKEAAAYFNIGIKKMRRIAEDNLGTVAVFCGNRFLIIRPKFEEFILNSSEI